MPHYTSFLPPNMTPPEPPESKIVALIFSIFMSVVLLLFVGFLGFDLITDFIGHPLDFAPAPLPESLAPLPKPETPIAEILEQFQLVTPKHQTRILGPEVIILCTWHPTGSSDRPPVDLDLWIDDIFVPWGVQYGNNTWFARVKLGAGQHHLQTAAFDADIFVELPESPLRAPDIWKLCMPHPNTNKVDRCDDCHAIVDKLTDLSITGRAKTVGAWKGTASCFDCHKKEDCDTAHKKVRQPTETCTQCHTIH